MSGYFFDYDSAIENKEDVGARQFEPRPRPPRKPFQIPERTDKSAPVGPVMQVRLIDTPIRIRHHDWSIRGADNKASIFRNMNGGWPSVCLKTFGKECPVCQALEPHNDDLLRVKKTDPWGFFAHVWRTLGGFQAKSTFGGFDDKTDLFFFNMLDVNELAKRKGEEWGSEQGPSIEVFRVRAGNQWSNLYQHCKDYGKAVWDRKFGLTLSVSRKRSDTGGGIDLIQIIPKRATFDPTTAVFTYPDVSDKEQISEKYDVLPGWIGRADVKADGYNGENERQVAEQFFCPFGPEDHEKFAKGVDEFLSGRFNKTTVSAPKKDSQPSYDTDDDDFPPAKQPPKKSSKPAPADDFGSENDDIPF